MSLSARKIMIDGTSLAELCEAYRRERAEYIVMKIMKEVMAKKGISKKPLLRKRQLGNNDELENT